MKARKAREVIKLYENPNGNDWLVVKPAGYVEETSFLDELELMGLTGDMTCMDPMELMMLAENPDFMDLL